MNTNLIEMFAFLNQQGSYKIESIIVDQNDCDNDSDSIDCYSELGNTGKYASTILIDKEALLTKEQVEENRESFDLIEKMYKGIMQFLDKSYEVFSCKNKLIVELENGAKIKAPLFFRIWIPYIKVKDGKPYFSFEVEASIDSSLVKEKNASFVPVVRRIVKTNKNNDGGKEYYTKSTVYYEKNDNENNDIPVVQNLSNSSLRILKNISEIVYTLYNNLLEADLADASKATNDELTAEYTDKVAADQKDFKREIVSIIKTSDNLVELHQELKKVKKYYTPVNQSNNGKENL